MDCESGQRFSKEKNNSVVTEKGRMYVHQRSFRQTEILEGNLSYHVKDTEVQSWSDLGRDGDQELFNLVASYQSLRGPSDDIKRTLFLLRST